MTATTPAERAALQPATWIPQEGCRAFNVMHDLQTLEVECEYVEADPDAGIDPGWICIGVMLSGGMVDPQDWLRESVIESIEKQVNDQAEQMADAWEAYRRGEER